MSCIAYILSHLLGEKSKIIYAVSYDPSSTRLAVMGLRRLSCMEKWWWLSELLTGMMQPLGPGGGAKLCRGGRPELEGMRRAGLMEVWSGVTEGDLSSSELSHRDLFSFTWEVNELWPFGFAPSFSLLKKIIQIICEPTKTTTVCFCT